MIDGRVRNVILVVVAGLALTSVGTMYGRRQTEPAVVITGTQPAVPNPAAGDPSTRTGSSVPDSQPIPQAPDAGQATLASDAKIFVHVAGAVKHPDLYSLPAGTRVAGAIKAAGGPTADADIDAINLAEKVVDGEKVYVPHKGQSAAPADGSPGNTIGLASSTPTDTPAMSSTSPVETHRSGHSGPGHSSNKLTDPSEGRVNINTASATELERLPGVGPSTAARIIEYRKQNGGFKKPDDLMQVGGIGEKKMAKLAPFVVVR